MRIERRVWELKFSRGIEKTTLLLAKNFSLEISSTPVKVECKIASPIDIAQ
jgi:hypothetical protein